MMRHALREAANLRIREGGTSRFASKADIVWQAPDRGYVPEADFGLNIDFQCGAAEQKGSPDTEG
jgi:hypothetical protein